VNIFYLINLIDLIIKVYANNRQNLSSDRHSRYSNYLYYFFGNQQFILGKDNNLILEIESLDPLTNPKNEGMSDRIYFESFIYSELNSELNCKGKKLTNYDQLSDFDYKK